MEISKQITNIYKWILKYKYVVLIIIIGIVLLSIPTKQDRSNGESSGSEPSFMQQKTIEEQLTDILHNVKGAGKVKVMLTVAQGEEIIYQTNSNLSVTNDSTKEDFDTVTITDSARNQNGLIRQMNPPTYLGAIVICQGADDPVTRLAITNAVSKVTGLKTNSISVLKMK